MKSPPTLLNRVLSIPTCFWRTSNRSGEVEQMLPKSLLTGEWLKDKISGKLGLLSKCHKPSCLCQMSRRESVSDSLCVACRRASYFGEKNNPTKETVATRSRT